MAMNTRCIIQVKVPTLIPVHFRLRMVGGQDGGAIPRLDLMEMATPRAMITSPRVEIPYRMAVFLRFMKSFRLGGANIRIIV